VAKQFNASSQGGLSINGQTIRIQQYNGFEIRSMIGLYVSLGKKFQIFADEFDALAMTTFHRHDVRLHFNPVTVVDFLQKIIQ
jgi:hypothetical protein